MATNYPERRAELEAGFAALAKSQPKVMRGFGAMHRSAVEGAVLDAGTKELIALAIGVSSQCDGCIAFHVHDAIKAGVTEDQLTETLGVAVLMGGGPAAVYAADALTAYRQFVEADANTESAGASESQAGDAAAA